MREPGRFKRYAKKAAGAIGLGAAGLAAGAGAGYLAAAGPAIAKAGRVLKSRGIGAAGMSKMMPGIAARIHRTASEGGKLGQYMNVGGSIGTTAGQIAGLSLFGRKRKGVPGT